MQICTAHLSVDPPTPWARHAVLIKGVVYRTAQSACQILIRTATAPRPGSPRTSTKTDWRRLQSSPLLLKRTSFGNTKDDSIVNRMPPALLHPQKPDADLWAAQEGGTLFRALELPTGIRNNGTDRTVDRTAGRRPPLSVGRCRHEGQHIKRIPAKAGGEWHSFSIMCQQ